MNASNANNCESKAPSTTPQLLSLDLIAVDERVQARAGTESKLIDEYAEAMRKGDEFPAITVFHDGPSYWLADGFHRHSAALRARIAYFRCVVNPGGLRDVILFATGANASYGRQRSNEDKRVAVGKLLSDDEWFRWSDREIARHCHVSHQLVAEVRRATGRATSERRYRNKHRGVGTMSIERIGTGGNTGQDNAIQQPVPAVVNQTAAPSPAVALVQPSLGVPQPAAIVVQPEVSSALSQVEREPDAGPTKSAEGEGLRLLAHPETSPKSEAKGSAAEPVRSGHTHKSRPSGKTSILDRATAMAIENERLKTELAIATESLGNVKADFESLRNAASSEVGLPTKAATIPPAAAPQGAPAETDLELPTFLDRRLTDGLSETETREFVSVTAMWQASDLRRALLNTSPTVRDRFQTMVLGSATARDN